MTVPMLAVVAQGSGVGKTTLLKRLVHSLTGRSVRVGLIKHAHHRFEIDHPGKDSFELRKAGADQVLVASPHRMAWIEEKKQVAEPTLQESLALLHTERLDLILVEGFRHEAVAKIEVYREGVSNHLMCLDAGEMNDVMAVVVAGGQSTGDSVKSDLSAAGLDVPVFDAEATDRISDFVLSWAGLSD